jgi:putative tricarboxylic transport membrane protein
MEAFLAALAIVGRPDLILAMIAGAVGGVVIGAIPGVGPPIAIAILLPATFGMDPIVGLTLLLGIYGSSLYGGAIPAILLNTPGTAVNAMTTYDGWPMTQRGEAPRALGLAYGASFVGGMMAVAALVLFAPVLARIAPLFGSREIFLAAVLGMVMVVIVHRGRSLAAGALLFFGIFLATVGYEPVRYTARYTFGQSWLSSGVDLIVVVLGLFAIAQALDLLTGRDTAQTKPRIEGSILKGLAETARHPRVAASGSGYGVAMGIIPGVGEFMAQFLSYATARGLSRNPERFGKGSPEGIVASESANNAVPPAAMVPLLALGIPGEELTAMMLSVFYVHNVIPGPGLFQTRMDFVYALYITLAVMNVAALLFVIAFTRPMLRVIAIPERFLGMAILTLSFVGVYSIRNSVTDCAVAAAFGFFGFLLKRLDLPAVPVILGMVLGRIAEEKFRTALPRIKSPWDWIDRPVAQIIFAAIVLVVLLHLWSLWHDRRKRA